ncbi:DUF6912 family protein [Williamsia sterculiae]|uniref:Uncharacterized protein n=1 Tax=Williamsia sterculiae TaxID=1344003 RepID=A0A1N7GT78_9NOCA|nr:hypothetical protein [Williamsia sterculiae]SIS15766.1 hypothetical protein SAMN05445060_3110 [Williamsia sterculiae]
MRVYLPATLSMLSQLTDSHQFAAIGGTGFALTPALRESYSVGDDEELSEAAMREAARASLRLLAAEPGVLDPDVDDDGTHAALPPRRVVVAADVDDDEVTLRPDLEPAVVKIGVPVPIADIASVHVDAADAESAIRVAAEVIDAADMGDEDAELAVGDVDDHDLAWYATQEIPFLLDLL